MAQYYYIGPWVWHTALEPEGECWAPPEGTVGAIDLRSLAACGLRGVVQGYGLFASDRLLKAPYLPLGTDLDARLDVVQKGGLEQNLSVPLGATTLRNALVELFTQKADPDQVRMCAGLGVKRDGTQEIWLAGQRIWSKRFQGVTDPAWPMVQAKYQRAYRSVRTQALAEAAATRALREGGVPELGTAQRSLYLCVAALAARSKTAFDAARESVAHYAEELHLRFLGSLAQKCPVDPRLLVPGDVPYEGLLSPQTSYSDDFNRAELGADWTAVQGTWSIYNSTEIRSGTGGANSKGSCRYEHDLSSDDYECQITWTYSQSGYGTMEAGCRFASAANTLYCAGGGYGKSRVIRKIVTGTATSLGSDSNGGAPPQTWKLSTDDTTLRMYDDGAEVGFSPITDLSITGNLRCGTYNVDSYADGRGDNWTCADLGAPPAGAVGLMLKETELGNSLLRGLIHAA